MTKLRLTELMLQRLVGPDHFSAGFDPAEERLVRAALAELRASPVRTPRGRDILAACGQLKSDSVRKSAAQLLRERETAAAAVAAKEAETGIAPPL